MTTISEEKWCLRDCPRGFASRGRADRDGLKLHFGCLYLINYGDHSALPDNLEQMVIPEEAAKLVTSGFGAVGPLREAMARRGCNYPV
ncbi:hypothetical protein Y032_0422g1191 [Ancylostoma ceylanicum]|uniref:Uncharacterized protein n=1 Tax=Ancylostoma ceylanicum TaxID=53326 RepID=A0A016X0L8_9BILA|nr:hypothetical protein Y032_0422g1191 [Ancylostoma ceylanicum]